MTPRRTEYRGEERRHDRRRDEDVADHEIAERAFHDVPLVSRLLKSGRMAAAGVAIGAVFGSATSLLGMRFVGPGDDIKSLAVRVDTNSARIARGAAATSAQTDSLVRIISDVKRAVETMAYIQCVQLRRNDSDLRPAGCDAAEQKGAPR